MPRKRKARKKRKPVPGPLVSAGSWDNILARGQEFNQLDGEIAAFVKSLSEEKRTARDKIVTVPQKWRDAGLSPDLVEDVVCILLFKHDFPDLWKIIVDRGPPLVNQTRQCLNVLGIPKCQFAQVVAQKDIASKTEEQLRLCCWDAIRDLFRRGPVQDAFPLALMCVSPAYLQAKSVRHGKGDDEHSIRAIVTNFPVSLLSKV